ncbi:hypothetical protein LGL00_26295, partial [Clostridium estertheticum]|nr:hypothetical protein [Clostridium estertheticum]
MTIINSIINGMVTFFGFDSSVTVMGIILLISIIVRVPVKKAILGALKVSIGLQGIMLIVSLIQTAMLSPIGNMVK